jgi:hypothetical protein
MGTPFLFSNQAEALRKNLASTLTGITLFLFDLIASCFLGMPRHVTRGE